MAKVLYITANPKSQNQSYSLRVGNAFLDAYQTEHPNDEIIHLDLYKMDIPFIDSDVLNGWDKLAKGESLTADEERKVNRINELCDQFISADKYIFVTPMWNFGFPPLMKAYIDTICIAGKTFKYTEDGPIGLLKGKKAVHIQARGGIYSEGPARDMEMGDRHLRAVLNFIGVSDIETVVAEGMAFMPDRAEEFVAKAIDQAKEVAKRF